MRYAPNPSKCLVEQLTDATGSRRWACLQQQQDLLASCSSATFSRWMVCTQLHTPTNQMGILCWLSLPPVLTLFGCNKTIQPENLYWWGPIPKLSPFCQWVEQSHLHPILWFVPHPDLKTSMSGEVTCSFGDPSPSLHWKSATNAPICHILHFSINDIDLWLAWLICWPKNLAVSIKVLERLFNVIKCVWAGGRKRSQEHRKRQRRDF